MSAPFAYPSDVAEAWRPLSADEEVRAVALIARASRKIRLRWPDVDARIEAGTLDAEVVADVVAEMVQAAMSSTAPPGVEQYAQNAGPFSESMRFSNPQGRLFFTAEMLRVFGGARSGRAFSVDLTPGA